MEVARHMHKGYGHIGVMGSSRVMFKGHLLTRFIFTGHLYTTVAALVAPAGRVSSRSDFPRDASSS